MGTSRSDVAREYIAKARAHDPSEVAIRDPLVRSGWADHELEALLSEVVSQVHHALEAHAASALTPDTDGSRVRISLALEDSLGVADRSRTSTVGAPTTCSPTVGSGGCPRRSHQIYEDR